MSIFTVLLVSGIYLGLLFGIAQYVERHPQDKRLRSAQGWIYALSIAVYCTSWTYYGSVGRAVKTGIGFLPIYIGPIVVFVLGSGLLRKMLRIAKEQHTTSIADFISSRYGKSHAVAVMVTIICLIGILPYIALQLDAVTNTFNLLVHYPEVKVVASPNGNLFTDTTLYIAVLIGLYVIAFGTRRVDVTEQHQGIVSAIAFESIIKLVAFLAVGIFVTFGLFGGFADLFAQAAANASLAKLLDYGATMSKVDFWSLTFLSGLAIFCLPRQFQVVFVENTEEAHLKPSRWLFPLYLVAINIFVLPLALAGQLLLGGKGVNPDTFVLTLPVFGHNAALAMFAFIGGLSAATGMIAVEAIALSTMMCNDIVMPLLVQTGLVDPKQAINLGALVKTVRRVSIMAVVLLGCAYAKLIGGSYTLVSIGLLSFVASAQFAPAMLLGMYWKQGTRAGAIAGLGCGFFVWLYTLLLPSFAKSGWLPPHFIDHGIFGVDALRPYQLFGVTGLDQITHGLMWSLTVNIIAYLSVSLVTKQSADEQAQARAFVDVFGASGGDLQPALPGETVISGQAAALATVGKLAAAANSAQAEGDAEPEPQKPAAVAVGVTLGDLVALVERFVGSEASIVAFGKWTEKRETILDMSARVDAEALKFTETQLTGVVGAANAQRMISSIALVGRDSVWLNPISVKLLSQQPHP
ncbi:MAG TPA: sodium:solute symporter [Candidatus Obscuribacterales bacterium]